MTDVTCACAWTGDGRYVKVCDGCQLLGRHLGAQVSPPMASTGSPAWRSTAGTKHKPDCALLPGRGGGPCNCGADLPSPSAAPPAPAPVKSPWCDCPMGVHGPDCVFSTKEGPSPYVSCATCWREVGAFGEACDTCAKAGSLTPVRLVGVNWKARALAAERALQDFRERLEHLLRKVDRTLAIFPAGEEVEDSNG